MEYKEALREQMEQYYQITGRYRDATLLAMKDARRPGLFKKKDYGPHLERFKSLIEELRQLDYKSIVIPEEDEEGRAFAELMDRSVISFMLLCEENIRFYEMTEKKQYKGSGVTVKGYAEATQQLQQILARAVNETGYLEQAYKEYFSGNLTDEE